MRRKSVPAVVIILLLCLSVFSCAAADGSWFAMLLGGEAEGPVRVSFISPSYSRLAQFGDDRRESLNRLLSHLSVDITLDGDASETAISIDGEKLFSVTESTEENMTAKTFSFEPDTVLSVPGSETEEESVLIRFLENDFCLTNRLMDEFCGLFEKTENAFPEYCKTSADETRFKVFGQAVRKVSITFPADYVSEKFPGAIADLADTEDTAEFLRKLLFSGTQKIVLLFNADGHMIRVIYDGTAGFSEESLRRVSLNWRCLRAEGRKKDVLTLKTPAVKGYDRYNTTYERDMDLTDPDRLTVSWDLQLDLKDGETKKRVQYTGDLVSADSLLSGNIVYLDRENGTDRRTSICPELKKENGDEYTGTIEITHKTGKIVTSSITAGFRAAAGETAAIRKPARENMTDIRSEAGKALAESLEYRMFGILVSRMLTLPNEDMDFLNRDIPDEAWNALIQSLY